MKRGNAHAVKLEGGAHMIEHVRTLTQAGIAVMGHIGLTPQSVHGMGGYRVQGRGYAAEQLIADARALEAAGAFAIVLEVVPQELAARITSEISIPTIGIGAGAGTDAQVIVWQDLLGLSAGTPAKFVKQYADLRSLMTTAVNAWAHDVVNGTYPDASHSYN
jgi:3-methyl-2-oxobutanoate hydroxymethyltransferase